jgi:hypothetical protein
MNQCHCTCGHILEEVLIEDVKIKMNAFPDAKGILAPAIVGIILNGLLLFIFVTNFMAARARAMQQHSGIEASPVVAVWSNKTRNADNLK